MTFADALSTTVAAALLGLSSVPHCAAMCGPLSAAACARSGGRNAPARYQLGRALGYTLAGVVAARFGLAVSDALPKAAAPWVFPVLTATACLLVALQLWPRRAPQGEVQRTPLAESESTMSARSSAGTQVRGAVVRRALTVLPRDAVYLGFASALLPCGALAGALLLAAGRGEAFYGGLFMLVFALTSGLATVAASALSRFLRGFRHPQLRVLRRALALGLLAFALVTVASPLRVVLAEQSNGAVVPASHCH